MHHGALAGRMTARGCVQMSLSSAPLCSPQKQSLLPPPSAYFTGYESMCPLSGNTKALLSHEALTAERACWLALTRITVVWVSLQEFYKMNVMNSRKVAVYWGRINLKGSNWDSGHRAKLEREECDDQVKDSKYVSSYWWDNRIPLILVKTKVLVDWTAIFALSYLGLLDLWAEMLFEENQPISLRKQHMDINTLICCGGRNCP